MYPVPPLSNPETTAFSTLEDWQKFDALRLFVARAQAVVPDFQITGENLTAVLQICQRLDGIPLAIELAAARVNVLSVADIAARLDDRFSLLVGGKRTAMPRHQTLRGMMEWSWELISQPEKDLLKRLSVFSSGMTLKAVEGVCCGDGIDPANILNLLTQLVNKSFVIAKRLPGEEIRYHLLETIRQYGFEQLEKQGLLEKYRNRHLAYFNQFGEEIEQELVGPEQATWIRKLRREMDNLRTALLWAREADIESGLKLLTSTWRFWAYGYMAEGENWLVQLLAQAENNLAPTTKAKALWVQSRLNMWPILKMNSARKLAEKSLLIYQELEDQLGIARSLSVIGWSYFYEDPQKSEDNLRQSVEMMRTIGDPVELSEVLFWYSFVFWPGYLQQEEQNYSKTKAYQEDSLALFQESGHLVGIISVFENLTQLAIFRGNYESAHQMLEKSLLLHKELGERGSSHTLENFGHLYYRTGDYASAHKYLEKSLSLSKQNGERSLHNWSTVRMGYVLLRMGELEQARETIKDALVAFKEDDVIIGVVYAIEGLACIHVILKQAEKSAILFAWADKTRKGLSDRRPPMEEEEIDQEKSTLIELIGEEAYSAAYAEGQSLSLEQAVELAMQAESD